MTRPHRPGSASDAPHQRRLFIAVPLDTAAVEAVTGLVERVRRSVETSGSGNDHPVRWVRLEGLHLTLRFLGATPDDRRPAIEAAVRAATEGLGRFPIRLAGSGAFPSRTRPRVLWVGIAEGADHLRELAAAVTDHLVPLGYPPEDRPYSAHLTLARTDGLRAGPPTAAALAEAADGWSAEFTADRVTLFESRMGGGPARYLPLLEVALGG